MFSIVGFSPGLISRTTFAFLVAVSVLEGLMVSEITPLQFAGF